METSFQGQLHSSTRDFAGEHWLARAQPCQGQLEAETMNFQSQEHLLALFDSLVWMWPESPLMKTLANDTDFAQLCNSIVEPHFFPKG